MKILNINSYYFSSSVHRQLQLALRSDKEIDAISYVPLARGYVARPECQYKPEQSVVVKECYNERDRYIFHIKHWKIYKDVILTLNVPSYDLIHAHSLFSNGYIAMKLKEKFGIPFVVAVRDTDVNTFFRRMPHLRRMGRSILQAASKVVFLSEPYRDHLVENYVEEQYKEVISSKSVVIPSGIADFWFSNKGEAKTLESKKGIKVLLVGRISKRKNIPKILEALNILKKRGYEIRFTAVGQIDDKDIHQAILNEDFAEYVAPVQKEQLLNIYRQHDIFVMPSKTETFGLVYPEAMSQGLPVIYTRGQGFDGQFEEGVVGYSADSNCAEEIADRIISIASNYDVIAARCITLVDKFRWDNIVQKYLFLYRGLL
ncbi:MAG: glycosyltransferase family 4 protein [Bacillota bacterium]|nr:glycosyltransferase family 4 protein [Bacillota bacterium]